MVPSPAACAACFREMMQRGAPRPGVVFGFVGWDRRADHPAPFRFDAEIQGNGVHFCRYGVPHSGIRRVRAAQQRPHRETAREYDHRPAPRHDIPGMVPLRRFPEAFHVGYPAQIRAQRLQQRLYLAAAYFRIRHFAPYTSISAA